MEKQQLPNSTLILVMGILSIIFSCCSVFVGLIFGIIALVLSNNATRLYLENPELFDGYANVKTGRILGIIGIVLNTISLIIVIIFISIFGFVGLGEWVNQIGNY